MSVVLDTSVLIDFLRGHQGARETVRRERAAGQLHASEVSRLAVLAGMRPKEEAATRLLLSTLTWHPLDADVAEQAGALGRRWLPNQHTIGAADLAIAATVILTGSRLLTRNTKHFPMFRLTAPYE